MITRRLKLFRVLGIPISMDLSWLIIVVLASWSLAEFFATNIPGYTSATYWTLGITTALSFFVCLVLHEMGHALVARRVGIPIRGITLFLFGGVAELDGEPERAKDELFMAIAGPAVSAAIALGLWLISWLDWSEPTLWYLRTLAGVNIVVLIFNMIPAFPLDGGRVLRSIIWWSMGNLRKATRIASMMGQGFGWVLIAYGLLNLLMGLLLPAIWFSLIGLFLMNAAKGSYQQVLIRDALRGESVRRFMNSQPITVSPDTDLRHWVDDYVYRYHLKTYPVTSNGHLEGVISTRKLSQYPREEWDRHTVRELMDNLEQTAIAPEDDAVKALSRMMKTGSSRLLVAEGDRLVGILSLKDLLRFLDLKMELEEAEEIKE